MQNTSESSLAGRHIPRPRTVATTGDDSPAPSIWGYVWRMTGWHQVGAGMLGVAVAILAFVPVELQRRLIDDAITPGDLGLLWVLGLSWLGVLIVHQAFKVSLALMQGWLAESAARYTREHLLSLRVRPGRMRHAGEAVAIVGPEVDHIAGFAGTGPTQGIQNIALLLGGTGYMLWVDPKVAAVGLILLLPQALLAPVMQRRLNRLVRVRLRLMRALGNSIADGPPDPPPTRPLLTRIYGNRIALTAWKAWTKAALNLLNGLAPLSVLVIGGWLAIEGETTVGVLVAFVSGFQRLAEPLRALVQLYHQYAQATVQHSMIARWM
jgi:ABC-type bacteriocin/lantibiotic exporter with double-glycine peptidase domain